jgi:hypothetical protein
MLIKRRPVVTMKVYTILRVEKGNNSKVDLLLNRLLHFSLPEVEADLTYLVSGNAVTPVAESTYQDTETLLYLYRTIES